MYRFVFPLAISCVAAYGLGQYSPSKVSLSPDLSWIREFASHSRGDEKGRENDLNMDPRFQLLLKHSLRQQQFFWRDHGRFTTLPDLVQTFIGVPGDVLLEQNRYVTANGCVPHDCGDRGMIWMDTAPSQHPLLIFVATEVINGPTGNTEAIHLWLFSTLKLDWQHVPPPFLGSISEWWNSTSQNTGLLPQHVTLVTLVQPSGEMVDLSPVLFGLAGEAGK